MGFLRNTWYAAGWVTQLKKAPIAITILDEPLLIVCAEDGKPSALTDTCPHRFAPLSMGKIASDRVQCPYHGLVFDLDGNCVHNPHGNGKCPSSLKVETYPVTFSDGIVWVWMGDKDKAEGVSPPPFDFLQVEDAHKLEGYLHVGSHYELVTDNLLDLSHVEFLHPMLSTLGYASTLRYEAKQDGNQVTAYHYMDGQEPSPLFRMFHDASVTRTNGRAHMHWLPPANMLLDTGSTPIDGADKTDAALPMAHLLTPESATSTHYFWAAASEKFQSNEQFRHMVYGAIDQAFKNEDEPMVVAVAARMKGRDLLDMSPVLLPMDAAAMRARRTLQKMINEESVP